MTLVQGLTHLKPGDQASANAAIGYDDDRLAITLGGNHTVESTTFLDDHSKWSFAWALYAGLAYQVTPTFTVDLSYRYVNLGSAQTGPAHAFDGFPIPTNPFVFDTLTSHDLMLGVRWNFGSPPPPPPIMRKG